MVTKRQIQDFARRVAAYCQPQRIFLFGSYAYGQPTSDSDVDMLVVMPFRGEGYLKAAEIHLALNPRFPLDLLVRTPAQLEKRLRLGDFFLREITEKGIVLYETADRRVDKKGRRGFRSRIGASSSAQEAKTRRRIFPRAAVRRKVS